MAETPHALYARYGPALLRKARRVLGNDVDAEDVVHGLFVDLLQKPSPTLDLPYLYRAVTNRCLSLVRDRNTRERLLFEHGVALQPPARTRLDERTVGLDLLAQLTERLDDNHLETLIFRFFDDLRLEEIARVMGVSRKTVGNRLARIQQEVREFFTPLPGATP